VKLAQENDYFMPNIFPTLRCRPDRVKGTPVLREIFCLSLVKPMARFHENVNPGPSFISIASFYLSFQLTLQRTTEIQGSESRLTLNRHFITQI
jgi:hypothetical protein